LAATKIVAATKHWRRQNIDIDTTLAAKKHWHQQKSMRRQNIGVDKILVSTKYWRQQNLGVDRSLHSFTWNYEKMKQNSLRLSNLLGDWSLEGAYHSWTGGCTAACILCTVQYVYLLEHEWLGSYSNYDLRNLKAAHMEESANTVKVGSLKMNTTLEYSTRVVQEGDRRCKKSTLNDLAYLTPLRIPLMNPVHECGSSLNDDLFSDGVATLNEKKKILK
jgi:hypothetical protein